MLPSLIQKTTIALALTLVGLVGGVGTGLHWLFGCSHHCHCSENGRACSSFSSGNTSFSTDRCSFGCCHRDAAVDHSRKAGNSPHHADGTFAESDEDCAICQLLSQFHSSSIDSISLHVAWGNRDSLALSIPEIPTDSSHRLEPPRGPPQES